MPVFRQARAAFICSALVGLDNLRAKHGVDFTGQSRRTRVAHPHMLGRRRDRAKPINSVHQFSLAASKPCAAWQDDFKAKIKGAFHSHENTTAMGQGQ